MDQKFNTFNELWEACEQTFSDSTAETYQIINEITAKLEVYKGMSLNTKIDQANKEQIKNYLLGNILLSLTHLSLKDNINTFAVLLAAFNEKSTT